jgi:hypothetical protein
MSLRCIKSEIINELKTDFFIETGTLSGDGVLYALELGFPNIISIDIDHIDGVYEKFSVHKNVTFIEGDSGACLWDAIKDKNQKVTFWLDAHGDLIKPSDGRPWNPVCPVLEELDQIKKHYIKDHYILVDDITDITKLPGISKISIEKKILEINPNYRICYADTGGTQTLIATTNGKDYNSGLFAYRDK